MRFFHDAGSSLSISTRHAKDTIMPASPKAQSTMFRNAWIVDGTGARGFKGDLLVQGGLIAAIGDRLEENAEQEQDCEGKVLCPGFIDVHTHDDAMVLSSPEMLPKISQGVTTVVVGNCGISLAPLTSKPPVAPLTLLDESLYRFPTIAAYRDAVNQAMPSVNVAALIGHSALRLEVLDDWRRPATELERLRMGEMVREAMDHGAVGMSSGTFYQTAYAADILELIPLVRVVASARGLYVTHMRTEMDDILAAIDEVALTARHAGAPLVISHHKCAGRLNWGRSIETLTYIDGLHKQQSIHLDVYPYVAGSTMLRLDMVDEETEVLITSSEPHPELVGESLSSIADAWKTSQREAAKRLMPGGACYFQMHEDDVVRILQHPRAMVGSDGIPHDSKPHPRLWGTFPRVLGEYVRHRRCLSLEAAIHKMTGLSAKTFKLGDRGLIRLGFAADLTIFDPETIEDLADFHDPTRPAKGIVAVYLAGRLAYDFRGHVLNRFGRFIARSNPS